MAVRRIIQCALLTALILLPLRAIGAEVAEVAEGVKVIAHRGYWEGTAQNSRESLRRAQALEVYGSETDVWLTTDGHLFVNHDPSFNGVVIKESTSEQCRQLVLSNGERMPELTDFLEMIGQSGSRTKLIIEIKDHSDEALNRAAAKAVVSAVSDYGVGDKVEYISFSAAACEQIIEDDDSAQVSYLSGDRTPDELHVCGYTGLDYNVEVFKAHPEWVAAAKQLGMTVNVWTVNDAEDMQQMKALGVDYLTTDKPVEALKY